MIKKIIITFFCFYSSLSFSQIKLTPEDNQTLPKEHINMLSEIMSYNGNIKAYSIICGLPDQDIRLFEQDLYNKLNSLELPTPTLTLLKDKYNESASKTITVKNRQNTDCSSFLKEFKKIKSVL